MRLWRAQKYMNVPAFAKGNSKRVPLPESDWLKTFVRCSGVPDVTVLETITREIHSCAVPMNRLLRARAVEGARGTVRES